MLQIFSAMETNQIFWIVAIPTHHSAVQEMQLVCDAKGMFFQVIARCNIIMIFGKKVNFQVTSIVESRYSYIISNLLQY